MQYCKPNVVMFLTLVGLGIIATSPVRADTAGEGSRSYFKGATSTCLSSATTIYPCISLSPPAYQPNPGVGIVSAAAATPYLPLDSDAHDSQWLAKLKNGEYWNPKWLLSRQLDGVNMDFTLDHSGAVVNMKRGFMKFNVNVDEGGFSESRFFLGIDRPW